MLSLGVVVGIVWSVQLPNPIWHTNQTDSRSTNLLNMARDHERGGVMSCRYECLWDIYNELQGVAEFSFTSALHSFPTSLYIYIHIYSFILVFKYLQSLSTPERSHAFWNDYHSLRLQKSRNQPFVSLKTQKVLGHSKHRLRNRATSSYLPSPLPTQLPKDLQHAMENKGYPPTRCPTMVAP